MNFLINIDETIKRKSKDVIFLKDEIMTTTNIEEAKLFNDEEANKIIQDFKYIILKEDNLNLITVINNKVKYNRFMRKHLN